MLAIVWALQNLRNYLYGKTNTIVYTDHQTLTFATSEKNPNAQLKRWKAFIEECGVTLKYKPRKMLWLTLSLDNIATILRMTQTRFIQEKAAKK